MKHGFASIYRFYLEGFKNMRLGKTLWVIIIIKLCIMFLILKPFFFPNFLNRFSTEKEKSGYVGNELFERTQNNK
jgi:hypothetical protein